MSGLTQIPIGILTVSDRAAAGTHEDRGGPGVIAVLTETLATPWHPLRRVVPDDCAELQAALVELTDASHSSDSSATTRSSTWQTLSSRVALHPLVSGNVRPLPAVDAATGATCAMERVR